MRKLILISIGALTLLAMPPLASANTSNHQWSGWMDTFRGTDYPATKTNEATDQMEASFKVPQVDEAQAKAAKLWCAPGIGTKCNQATFWAGLGGLWNSGWLNQKINGGSDHDPLIQTGILESYDSTRKAMYLPFWEVVPSPKVPFKAAAGAQTTWTFDPGVAVRPGDTVKVDVSIIPSCVGSTAAFMEIIDQSQHNADWEQEFDIPQVVTPKTAELIAEKPSFVRKYTPTYLTPFKPVTMEGHVFVGQPPLGQQGTRVAMDAGHQPFKLRKYYQAQRNHTLIQTQNAGPHKFTEVFQRMAP